MAPVARHREAQLEAVAEGVFVSPVEVLTTGPTDRTVDRWLQRTLSQVGEQLGVVRDSDRLANCILHQPYLTVGLQLLRYGLTLPYPYSPATFHRLLLAHAGRFEAWRS